MNVFRKIVEPFTQYPAKAALGQILKSHERILETQLSPARTLAGKAMDSARVLVNKSRIHFNSAQAGAIPPLSESSLKYYREVAKHNLSLKEVAANSLFQRKPELFKTETGEKAYKKLIKEPHERNLESSRTGIKASLSKARMHMASLNREEQIIADLNKYESQI